MRKKEFLKTLDKELSHLDRDERNDIIDYYDELIEDTIEKTGKSEGAVIYDLGEIEDIVRRIDPSHRRRMQYEEVEETRNYPKRADRGREDNNSSSRTALGIVLLICLFPLWIALFAVLFSLIVVIISIGITCIVGGILLVLNGFSLFTTAPWAQGVFRIGIGLALVGITIFLIPLLFKIIVGIGKLIITFFRWLFSGRRR